MILASLKKEALIILSDVHSIGVLLILPVAFMLIMTFAMSEQQNDIVAKTSLYLNSAENNDFSLVYQGYLAEQGFQIVDDKAQADIAIDLPTGFDERILTGLKAQSISLDILSKISPQRSGLLVELVQVALAKLRLHAYMLDSGELEDDISLEQQIEIIGDSTNVADYFLITTPEHKLASATLYSVPSWIIFGIYFIVLPVSITVINEKQNGTLIRLKTFPISSAKYFISKVSAFCLLSALQFIILTLIGIYAVPVITEQPEIVISNWPMYAFSALFIIVSANALAFLVAALVNSYEQAIVLGGGINILLAAVSGFMVPIDIMPQIMADIASFSPLYWSAEIIRAAFSGKDLGAVMSYIINLSIFSLVTMALAKYLFEMKIRKLTWN